MRGPAQPSDPLQGPGSPTQSPQLLSTLLPRRGQSWVGGTGGVAFRSCKGAGPRRAHSGSCTTGFIHRAGGQPGGAEPTPAPLPERVRREDPAGGAQVSARVRGAGLRPRSWKSRDARSGCSPAGAGRDARAGGGAGWSRAARLGGGAEWGRTREGGDGQTMCGNARGGSPGRPCSVRVGRVRPAWASARGGAESAQRGGREAPPSRGCDWAVGRLTASCALEMRMGWLFSRAVGTQSSFPNT